MNHWGKPSPTANPWDHLFIFLRSSIYWNGTASRYFVTNFQFSFVITIIRTTPTYAMDFGLVPTETHGICYFLNLTSADGSSGKWCRNEYGEVGSSATF